MSKDKGHVERTRYSLLARRKSLFWRIHFWAALIASPFALMAAVTGILYVFTPQIEAMLYASLDRVTPSGAMRPLDDAVAAARLAAPAGWQIHSVLPPHDASETVKVVFAPASGAKTKAGDHQHGPAAQAAAQPAFGLPAQAIVVSVNPYTAEVTGNLADRERFSTWAKRLHSRWLQNDNWRWMIELAASWLMVMLLTGIYLWWPRGAQTALPQAGAKGRIAWRQWHSVIGVALAAISFIMLATGLTWSKYAGGQIRSLRDAIGQTPPRIPHGLQSIQQADTAPMTWQAVLVAARRQVPDSPLQLTPPRGNQGTWRISSAERTQPDKRVDLVLDAYTGQALYYSGWERQTVFGKATAVGIPFHRGELGWWNQVLLLLFGSGVLFSLVSGWVMFFKRRGPESFGLPPLLPGAWKSAPSGAWIVAAIMFLMMPLLALSAVVVAAIEIMLRKPWKQAHGCDPAR
jgi:uncharacterized iron-regulated membrane protein